MNTCLTWTDAVILTGEYIVLYEVRNAEVQYVHLLYKNSTVDSDIVTSECMVLCAFSVQSGMLEYNKYTWWTDSVIIIGECIVLLDIVDVTLQ